MTGVPAAEVVVPAAVPGPVRQRRLSTGEVELGIVEVGPATAPAVVVAHGVGSSARFVLEAFAAPVLAWGGRLVAYDLRGHAASTPLDHPDAHALDAHVRDLVAVVTSLDDAPAVVGGVSLGGHAVIRAASRGLGAPALLACLPAWTGPATRGEGPHAAVAAEVRRVGSEAVIDRLRADTTMEPWLRATLLADYPRHHPASLTAALAALDGGDAPDETELCHLGARPLAVVGWPDDPGHPLEVARRWAELAPQGVLGQLAIGDLATSRARLGEVAVATLRRAVPAWARGLADRRRG